MSVFLLVCSILLSAVIFLCKASWLLFSCHFGLSLTYAWLCDKGANNLTFHAQLYRLESQLQIPTIVTLLGSVRVRQDWVQL